jgi:hypothetical protein
MRTFNRKPRRSEVKLAVLRAAIDEGDSSGLAEDKVFARLRKTLKLPGLSAAKKKRR